MYLSAKIMDLSYTLGHSTFIKRQSGIMRPFMAALFSYIKTAEMISMIDISILQADYMLDL